MKLKKSKKILAILLINLIFVFAITTPAKAVLPAVLAGESLYTAITMLEGQGIYYNNMTNATEGANAWFATLSHEEQQQYIDSINLAVTQNADYIYMDTNTGQYFPPGNIIYDDIQRYKLNTDRTSLLLSGGYKLYTYVKTKYQDGSPLNGYDVGAYIKNSSNVLIAGYEYIPVQANDPNGYEYWYQDAIDRTFIGFKNVTGRTYTSGDIFGLPYKLDVTDMYDEYGHTMGSPYIPNKNISIPLDKYIPIPKTLSEVEQHLNITNDPTQTYIPIQTGDNFYNPDTQTTEEYKKPLIGQLPTTEPTTEIGFWGTVSQLLTSINTGVNSLATTITDAFSTTAEAEATINFEPLKLTANVFTTKFPFSLPWDLYRMVQSIDKGDGNTPRYVGMWNGVEVVFDFTMFNGVVEIARILELVGFNIGLVVATRRYLGGAT